MVEKEYYQVVIVDDIKAVANSLRRELNLSAKKSNIVFRINDFQDPEEGLKYIETNPVDLVISDIKMPYLPGDKLIEIVKEKFPELPIMVITGFASKENVMAVLQADKNCVILTKPWELEKLIDGIGALLKIPLKIPKDYDK